MSGLLPEAFKDLEYLVPEWSIRDGHQRYVKRVNSSIEELRAFYDVMFPRGQAAIDFIDQFEYSEALTEDVSNLRDLLYTLITVAIAVEVWRQPRVRNSANTILTRLA
ncbi:hypothetical protein FT643_20450 [Ketobacter sp. MCCC 1A13808]|uniref:hypothetical protein n=1 Tax=Ketobacter sp. MCCC 1A13808 TaxID=2602738 RepID=UPI000F0DCB38|nr:hypothetical protein [Ketobacter sp. MCCC 1A13808]MVF14512.1 hypothetical protein [Ketobacter sp. MCCC 1A13808]RLP55020.1 MAG: hypothetical protein D6160_07235 [Ketobacter sp.]